MATRNEKYFVVGMAALVVFAFFYMQDKESLVSEFFDRFTSPDWDEVSPRNIVKVSIPITLLESDGSNCKVDAMRFNDIIDHPYFVACLPASSVAYQITNSDFSASNFSHGIVSVFCSLSWFNSSASCSPLTKYQYWINPWEETSIEKD